MSMNHDRFSEAAAAASAVLAVADHLSSVSRERLLDSVQRAKQMEMLVGQLPVGSVFELELDTGFHNVANLLESVISQLPGMTDEDAQFVARGIDSEVEQAVEKIKNSLEQHIEINKTLAQDPRPTIRSILSNVTIARQVDEFLAESVKVRDAARESLEKVKEAASQAQAAAGTAGESSLSTFFEAYALHELRSSNSFRVATIATIVGAIIVAVAGSKEVGDDLTRAIYHVAIVAGIAGLATYFGRQAGHHRRVGTWAKALQIQLQSFPAFMAAIPDDKVKGLVYEAFAKRLLGAPPESKVSSDTSAEVMTQPLIDAVLRAAAPK